MSSGCVHGQCVVTPPIVGASFTSLPFLSCQCEDDYYNPQCDTPRIKCSQWCPGTCVQNVCVCNPKDATDGRCIPETSLQSVLNKIEQRTQKPTQGTADNQTIGTSSSMQPGTTPLGQPLIEETSQYNSSSPSAFTFGIVVLVVCAALALKLWRDRKVRRQSSSTLTAPPV